MEVTLLPGAAGRPAVDRSRRALQIDLTGGRAAGLAKATARSRRRRSCCRRRTCGGGAACLGAPPHTATARMVRCHQGARAGAAPPGSGFFCTSRSPWARCRCHCWLLCNLRVVTLRPSSTPHPTIDTQQTAAVRAGRSGADHGVPWSRRLLSFDT